MKAVRNDADLKTIGQLFETREMGLHFNDAHRYFPKDVTLQEVLQDAKASIFITDARPDQSLIVKFDLLIKEETAINPFDGLKPLEREVFETIRRKLGSGYSTVQPEIEKVVIEMRNKNDKIESESVKTTTGWIATIVSFFLAMIGAPASFMQLIAFLKRVLRRGQQKISVTSKEADAG